MTNDWSSFTSKHITAVASAMDSHAGPGYLFWAKIDHQCLYRANLGNFLTPAITKVYSFGDYFLDQVCQAIGRVIHAIEVLKARGITKVCLGVSWCDWVCMPGARAWIKWYVCEFAKHFEVLPRVTFTPPPYTDGHTINAPPRDILTYAEFLEELLHELGNRFGTHVELWNEWNLNTDWRWDLDPEYKRFAEMIKLGAAVARRHGKKVVLGGMAGITTKNFRKLELLERHGLFEHLDVVGYHDLRGTWGDQIPSASIPQQVRWVKDAIKESHLDVWLTEYGFPVVDPEHRFSNEYLEEIQVALFAYATYCIATGAIDRVYWYTFQDYVGESVRAHTTGWEDVLQYYYGDTCEQGRSRKLAALLNAGGPRLVLQYAGDHQLFPLVDAASLGRKKPKAYKSNSETRAAP